MTGLLKILRETAFMLVPAIFLASQPALAQTDVNGNEKAKLERLNRKNLKESKEYKSDYKDTHLDTSTYQYKTGKAGRKAARADKARLRKENAGFLGIGLFKRKKKQ